MIDQKKYAVDIDERKDVFCTEQNRVVRSDLTERFNGRPTASSPLVAVLMAYDSCKKDIKDIDMLEVKVDGVNFPG
jgi:hypothetical protein